MKSILAALALALTMGAALPASAAIITINVRGVLIGGEDDIGLFGAQGADLTGDRFKARYVFNTKFAQVGPDGYNNLAQSLVIFGGKGGNTTLTVDGSKYVVPNGPSDTFGLLNGPLDPTDSGSLAVGGNKNAFILSEIVGGSPIPDSVYAPFTGDCGRNGVADCEFAFDILQPLRHGNDLESAGGGIITRYVVNVSGVPEPSTWSLMVAGLGLTGAALRRRRATALMGA